MLSEFLNIISEENSYQAKYLRTAMEDITDKEVQKLEKLLGFYKGQGNSVAQIARKYLNLIESLMEEQKYFIENDAYRYSTYEEAKGVYEDSSYMDDYVVGLGLSTYLWHVHRGIMRFFIGHIKNQKRESYLEIGPGHGEYFVTAMENSEFSTYTAVDISETSVNMTEAFCKYSIAAEVRKDYRILHKDFFDFMPDEKFDAVIMGEVLEHVENPQQFLNKIYDVAHDDAFIYITTAVNAPQLDHIYHFRHIDEVREFFKESNLEIVDQIALTANNVSLEKAAKKKYTIVAGFVLRKMNK